MVENTLSQFYQNIIVVNQFYGGKHNSMLHRKKPAAYENDRQVVSENNE